MRIIPLGYQSKRLLGGGGGGGRGGGGGGGGLSKKKTSNFLQQHDQPFKINRHYCELFKENIQLLIIL